VEHLKEEEDLAGFSMKTILLTLIGMLVFGIYVGVLMYGENSLTVLNQLKVKQTHLSQESMALKAENQHLQKEFFELKQLEPRE